MLITVNFSNGSVPSEEKSTPENRTIQNIIRALFTPYLTKLISRVPTNEVSACTMSCDCHVTTHTYMYIHAPLQLLKILNSNTENPYLIWDNRTRAELNKYLEEQQQAIVRTVSSTLCTFRLVSENVAYKQYMCSFVLKPPPLPCHF